MRPDPSRGRVPAEGWSEFVQWGERSGDADGATLVREMGDVAKTEETGNLLQISGGQPSFMQFNNIIRPMLDEVIEKLGVDPQRKMIPKLEAR